MIAFAEAAKLELAPVSFRAIGEVAACQSRKDSVYSVQAANRSRTGLLGAVVRH